MDMLANGEIKPRATAKQLSQHGYTANFAEDAVNIDTRLRVWDFPITLNQLQVERQANRVV